eukprot:1191526-Prorocentrum_minimum.AAC.2
MASVLSVSRIAPCLFSARQHASVTRNTPRRARCGRVHVAHRALQLNARAEAKRAKGKVGLTSYSEGRKNTPQIQGVPLRNILFPLLGLLCSPTHEDESGIRVHSVSLHYPYPCILYSFTPNVVSANCFSNANILTEVLRIAHRNSSILYSLRVTSHAVNRQMLRLVFNGKASECSHLNKSADWVLDWVDCGGTVW